MKPIPDFPGYFVDELGNIYCGRQRNFRCKPPLEPRIVKSCIRTWGYFKVSLRKDGKTFARDTHLLVLETFIGPRPEGMEGCHNDGNKANNRLENLRWDSVKNNRADKVKHGTLAQGERVGTSKLTEIQVRIVRRHSAMDNQFGVQQYLAKTFNVHPCTIRRAVAGITWSHI